MSAGNTTAADAGANHFTAAEVKFVLAALQHAEAGTLKFDADAVAQQLGLKDGRTARARWNTIARTKISNAPASGVDKSSPAKKNTKPKKEDGEDGEKAAPNKRGRKSKPEKTEEEEGVKVEAAGEEELA